MDETEVRGIANAWIEFERLPQGSAEREAQFWAFVRLSELVRDAPETAWQVITAIWQRDSSEVLLADLAAGPMEDLLALHGGWFIDRIETLARKEPIFKKLLGSVWKSDIADEVWRRIQSVAGPSF